jgi:hypothetical protein
MVNPGFDPDFEVGDRTPRVLAGAYPKDRSTRGHRIPAKFSRVCRQCFDAHPFF